MLSLSSVSVSSANAELIEHWEVFYVHTAMKKSPPEMKEVLVASLLEWSENSAVWVSGYVPYES